MSQQVMLSFFDESTVMAQPWTNAGYRSYCIDSQHPFGEKGDKHNKNIVRVGADVIHRIVLSGQRSLD